MAKTGKEGLSTEGHAEQVPEIVQQEYIFWKMRVAKLLLREKSLEDILTPIDGEMLSEIEAVNRQIEHFTKMVAEASSPDALPEILAGLGAVQLSHQHIEQKIKDSAKRAATENAKAISAFINDAEQCIRVSVLNCTNQQEYNDLKKMLEEKISLFQTLLNQ